MSLLHTSTRKFLEKPTDPEITGLILTFTYLILLERVLLQEQQIPKKLFLEIEMCFQIIKVAAKNCICRLSAYLCSVHLTIIQHNVQIMQPAFVVVRVISRHLFCWFWKVILVEVKFLVRVTQPRMAWGHFSCHVMSKVWRQSDNRSLFENWQDFVITRFPERHRAFSSHHSWQNMLFLPFLSHLSIIVELYRVQVMEAGTFISECSRFWRHHYFFRRMIQYYSSIVSSKCFSLTSG